MLKNTYCREYGNLPCDECNKKLEEKKAMSKYMPFINIPNVEMKSSKSKPMNKTKFTKVAVENSAQFEDNKSYYFITEWGEITKDVFISAVDFTEYSYRYKHFLEESPDREDEMREMLEDTNEHLKLIKQYYLSPELNQRIKKIDSLLQSLKQEK